MNKHFFLPALALAAITACASTTQVTASRVALSPEIERQAQSLASRDLIDPGSVQFRGLRAWQLSNGDVAVCGEQNARNRIGGYVGFQALYLRFTPGSVPVLNSLKREFLAQTACGALDSGRGLPVAEG